MARAARRTHVRRAASLGDLRMLSRVLRLPVYGTLVPLVRQHCAAGLRPVFAHVLVEASALS